ncbi:DUF5110 domain-containing protein [Fulvivirga sp. M361]|uniref:glycoside hydrolase family 31 protein n=1 Tax=Fulvivirga sp. M361 TaxID=2594266 RepID=UPI00117AB373|nr:glycoside hydrolase family 31 protein [Fulvivirga sp. M361]TRX61683.1 DUF5110 domain-containing protein [Fulvivirga sp. M361]
MKCAEEMNIFNRKAIVSILILQMILQTSVISGAKNSYDPETPENATVISDNCRFTVLTPRMIRMEWTEDGVFEDHASLVFVNRKVPIPDFTVSRQDGWVIIQTEVLTLKYKVGTGSFKTSNLTIEGQAEKKLIDWYPGKKNNGNLKGTTRTLDQVDGATPLEDGILSREGWTLIDDTGKPVFDNSDWPWVMSRDEKMAQDWYFMAYGSDYKQALADYTLVAGKVAFPPKYAFGAWQSRWWKYTDEELKELVEEYKTNDFPLDVLVIDMDWHVVNLPEMYDGKNKKPDQAGQGAGWTGFSWNQNYFPDPKGFLDWTDKRGIKTCMNLHPASGIQPHEDMYHEFASAMGVDPTTKKYIPFNITDKSFARNYFDIVLHPMEDDGVDFWWLDWQQWNSTDIPGVNPTYYLNYLHYTDMERRGKDRPMIYHRWGGLGNHRYQIGFSGDTYNTWKSLQFQPYFTATSSNVGWGYWGHDLGGFFKGKEEPELFTRWIQFGIFSPIVKIHYWAHPAMDRRPWAYPPEYANAMRDAYKLRYSLIPYIYTMARKAYDSGVCLSRPMYYESDDDLAYKYKDQYYFGDDLIIAPVIDSLGGEMASTKKVWLPKGQWINWSSGTLLDGGKEIEARFTISEIPVFVKAGAIIPMMPDMNNTGEKPVNPLILNIFPGANGAAKVYDDAGNTQAYQNGAYTYTSVSSKFNGKKANVVIDKIEGSYENMLLNRAYELRFPISHLPKKVLVNGQELPFSREIRQGTWRYDGVKVEAVVYTNEYSVYDKVVVEVEFEKDDLELVSGIKGLISRSKEVFLFARENHWPDWKYPFNNFVLAAQTGRRVNLDAKNALKEYELLRQTYIENQNQIEEWSKDNSRYRPLTRLLK